MERGEEMYKERQQLLRAFTRLDVPQSTALKLIEPMKTMGEEEKEAFAAQLIAKIEAGEIDLD